MVQAIKAIETHYSGYKFRSRLEARWAVFFDRLGIKYLYELEGFKLNGIWYLPDFWLPSPCEAWIEIKPNVPTKEECEKAIRLCVAKDECVVILAGDVWDNEYDALIFEPFDFTVEEVQEFLEDEKLDLKYFWTSRSTLLLSKYDAYSDSIIMSVIDLDRKYWLYSGSWTQCTTCKSVSLVNCGGAFVHKSFCEHRGKSYNDIKGKGAMYCNTPDIIEAFKVARQARFEQQS